MAENRQNSKRFAAKKYNAGAPETDNYGHLQPQVPELEKVVLGALMIEKDAYPIVSEILRPESFYEPRHQKIYEAIRRLSIAQNMPFPHAFQFCLSARFGFTPVIITEL